MIPYHLPMMPVMEREHYSLVSAIREWERPAMGGERGLVLKIVQVSAI